MLDHLAKIRPRGLKIVQEVITKGRPSIRLAMVAVKLGTRVGSALVQLPPNVFKIVERVEEEIDNLVEVLEKVTVKVCIVLTFDIHDVYFNM